MSKKPIHRVLGFDYGRLRIGVAVGQTLTASASPLCVLKARDGQPVWDEVEALLKQWQPDALIVGKPMHMDGNPHEVTVAATKFGNRLHGRYGLPVFMVDERLSSVEAEEQLRDLSDRKRSGKIELDSMAAKVIVETWLAQQQGNESA
ncbi:MAG: Holliday junction resolvase RuvX [Gammaproteobacteria bacterium]|nr:Holliday junction resolvase RuvX [Gammaproteobacteria bacterium]